MSFVRWVFYDADTGEVKYSGMQQGDFVQVTVEEAAKAFGVSGYAYMEWTEPDPEIEAAFSSVDADGNLRNVELSVDVSKDPPEIIFTYSPIKQPEDEQADMMEALTLLGVIPEEGE